MGRHSTQSPPSRKPAVLAAALVLAGLGGGGYGLSRLNNGPASSSASTSGTPGGSGSGTPGGSASGSGDGGSSDTKVSAAGTIEGDAATTGELRCAKGSSVSLSTTPDMAPTLRTLADKLKSQGEDCVTYDIQSIPAGVLGDRIGKGKKTPPQIWVPDSTVWLSAYNDVAKKNLDFGPVVATSPVGMVLPKIYIDNGVPAGAFTWASMMQSRKHAVAPAMSDPAYSTASMLLLASAQKAANDAQKVEAVKAEVMLMAQHPRDDQVLMQLAATGSPLAKAFPASEQQMLAEHKAAPNQKVSAVTVTGATPQFSYGVVPMSDDESVRSAADALRSALMSEEGRKALQDNGFRIPGTPSESAASAVNGMDMNAVGTPLPDPEPAQVKRVNRAWIEVHRKMRLILAVDESGSMLQKIKPQSNITRIQLATGVSLAALDQLPDDTEVAVRVFSDQRRGNGKPWVEVAGMRALASKGADGVTHRTALKQVAQKLPALPKGGTALYDTIRDAVVDAQANYDPSAVNSVVVWTDGVNRDAATITKAELLQTLRGVAVSAKPVRVVLVGMGQQSDMTTLHEIAAASGGTAYYALDPAAVQSVIAGALYARIEEAGASGN